MADVSLSATGSRWVLSGTVDFHNAEQLKDAGLAALQSTDSKVIAIDVASLHYEDSSVLAVFIAWWRAAVPLRIGVHWEHVSKPLLNLSVVFEVDGFLWPTPV